LTSRGSNISSKVFKIVASSAAIIDSSVSIRKLTDADTVSSKVGDTVGSVVGALEGYDVGASESIGCLKKN
jgi:Ca2+/H+ antiporter